MPQKALHLLVALSVAVLVFAAGNLPWWVLAFANLKVATFVPWSVPTALLYLTVYWMYLQGSGVPKATSQQRHNWLHAFGLSRSGWAWSLLACTLGVAAVFILYETFLPTLILPAKATILPVSVPMRVLIPMALTSAVFAGATEEAAFRGYMLSMLQTRYQSNTAIVIVACSFGIFHLSHGLAYALPRLPYYVAIGLLYGAITHRANSILPPMIVHVSSDALEFLQMVRRQIAHSPGSAQKFGIHHTLICTSIGIALAAGAAVCFHKLGESARKSE